MRHLRRADPGTVPIVRRPVELATIGEAAAIVEEVRIGGERALRRHAERLGDLEPGDEIVLDRSRIEQTLDSLPGEARGVLERVAGRIRSFAQAQRQSLKDVDIEVSGGRAGHRWIPVSSAGAYAPGGRYPLPSSVLMTAIPARVAGVESVWVASPRPTPVTVAAAAIAGADGLLAVGGAQAIAALAFGTLTPACDLVVGPGNRWVTAAKKYLYGEIGIDGLAGPSEILLIADESADPELVSADLLAQAEHDDDAVPMLITTSQTLADEVEGIIERQLSDLPTSETASRALENGFCLVVASRQEAASISNRIAPEHLALHVDDPSQLVEELRSYGSLFVGSGTAEAFADYGVGPNHVLPTGGGARYQSGLSVFTFLRSPTWMALDDAGPLVDDTMLLARLEGLEAHARAAQIRRPT
ncbi:MAG TPA: histidinol dehydrogenase [Acidimicrobiia bacterium]|nr:histidinol dehydrogenase [Acidimicrobiia bacterium]